MTKVSEIGNGSESELGNQPKFSEIGSVVLYYWIGGGYRGRQI